MAEARLELPHMNAESIERLKKTLEEEFMVKDLSIEPIENEAGNYLIKAERSDLGLIVFAALYLDIKREQERMKGE